mgnify:CR=1 FL=1
MERENIIEDKVSFRYYLEHNHDFVESTKNYGCVHNGVNYGAGMIAVEMNILNIYQNNTQVIANKKFHNGTLNFKGMLAQFVQYCANIDEVFERMLAYRTDRQFKVYSEKEYLEEKKYLEKHSNNSKSDGTNITISYSKITTKKDNSGGIMTTGGGTLNANNLTINTSGTSSAAIRSDRGGGSVNVTKGTYQTTGKGSPAIYSTANIKVNDATLIAKASEGVVIEGKNSVSLENCTLTDTNNTLNGQSTTYKNIFLYQSMSGDASVGNSEFTAKNSTITTNKGDTIYVTNTSSTINLENNTIINNDKTGYFLRAKSDSWGTKNENGGDVVLKLTNQKVTGNIYIDEISTLDMTLSNNSYYEGYINTENKSEKINLTLDKTSKIKLTKDTYITSLTNKDTTNSNIDFNGYKLYVNGKAIN